MDVEEHFYDDDPSVGHPDVRTRLDEVDYFFVGNGHIQAAVQVCRSGEGTPLGLLVLNPDEFGPKRAALTLDRNNGLRDTVVRVRLGDTVYEPRPTSLHARWDEIHGVPVVLVTWRASTVSVTEMFFCPDRTTARLLRRVEVQLPEVAAADVMLLTGQNDLAPYQSAGGQSKHSSLVYEIVRSGDEPVVSVRWQDVDGVAAHASRYWMRLTQCSADSLDLDRIFNAARCQLPVAVDVHGRMDGSIWQYNLEWVRDQAHVAEALSMLGDHSLARTMLARLLEGFVSADGDTVDSGRRRSAPEVELDQNGVLLHALRTYVNWTGDLALAIGHWEQVCALAEFPLRDTFRHRPSGMLHNEREYWERHAMHGIRDGCELMHQFWVAMGLRAAAYLAGIANLPVRDRWLREAVRLERAMLADECYHLIEDGHLIKRRDVNGTWQRTVAPDPKLGLPDEIPLMADGEHLLDPDSSCALLIAHRFIDPKGELAGHTLDYLEQLWNQDWGHGGYGRYHVSSEADSPGPWPFPSLFVARAYAEAGNDRRVLRVLRWLADKPGGRAGTWWEFDGWKPSPPCPQSGITPWTWAEVVMLYVHHILGIRPDCEGITVRPILLEGVDRMTASCTIRGNRLELTVRRATSASERCGRAGTERFAWEQNGVRIPLRDGDTVLEIEC